MTVTTRRGFSLRAILKNFIERRREIRAAKELLDLPDATLRDIGLSRWDIKVALMAGNPLRSITNIAAENREMYANYGCGRLSGGSQEFRIAA